jgi:hypothetical protein
MACTQSLAEVIGDHQGQSAEVIGDHQGQSAERPPV